MRWIVSGAALREGGRCLFWERLELGAVHFHADRPKLYTHPAANSLGTSPPAPLTEYFPLFPFGLFSGCSPGGSLVFWVLEFGEGAHLTLVFWSDHHGGEIF